MLYKDISESIIGLVIILLPVCIAVFIIFRGLRKEILQEMQKGKTFWQAIKPIFISGNYNCYPSSYTRGGNLGSTFCNGYQANSNGTSYSNNFNSMSTGPSFMTDSKYCSMSGNTYYNSSITGKY